MKRFGSMVLVWMMLVLCMQSGVAENMEKVVVNEVTHSVFYAPMYVAMEQGFFAKQGIEIDLVNGGGSDKSMTAVIAGAADIGLMGPETAVYVYNQGKKDHAVIIGQLTQCDGSFLVGREPEKDFDWNTLRGKTIIGGRKGGMPVMTLQYVLENMGLVLDEDVFVRTDIQFNLMAGAFEGSDAEYVTLFEPTASQCEQEGKGYIVASLGEKSGRIPYTAFMVKKSLVEQNSALYTRFLSAILEAQTWITMHTAQEIAEAIAPQFPDADVPLLTRVCQNYLDINAWKTTPVMEEEDFALLLDVIANAGELTERPDFSALVFNTLALCLP